MVLSSLMSAPACAQTSDSAANFDDCLIMHMAAIAMLTDAESEDDAALRGELIASQTDLIHDDRLDEDGLAARTSSLLQSYGRSAERAAAEAYAENVTPETLAAAAIACGKELAE